jgi:hypothetical protein
MSGTLAVVTVHLGRECVAAGYASWWPAEWLETR